MTVAAGWIAGGWILSEDTDQSGKFWIDDDRVWGPLGADEIDTGYWIANGWIFGPAGAADVHTHYYIHGGQIFGPTSRLPFARIGFPK